MIAYTATAVAVLVAVAVALGAVLSVVGLLLDDSADRRRNRRLDDLRRRQLADMDRRYGVHDPRPPT